MKSNDFMNLALDKALISIQEGGGPFGAVIVQNGKIIASGNNQVTLINDPTAHAEMVAIRNAAQALGRFNLDDCEIYSSCEPCPMCLGAIYWARIKKIHFAADKFDAQKAGFDDQFFYEELDRDPAERKVPMHKIEHSRALFPFNEWEKKVNKTPY